MTATTQTRQSIYRPVRCGWCIDGNHDLCATTIEIRPGQTWSCPCDCATNKTRCIDCGRRGVEVTHTSKCIDQTGCADYRARRYTADPAMQQIAKTRREMSVSRMLSRKCPQEASEGTSETLGVPARGLCPCCGSKTRGGRFLPGHDAKWVGQVVARVEANPGARDELLAQVESVSVALLAKVARRLQQ